MYEALSISQHTPDDSLRQPTSAYVSLRQPMSAYVSLRQPTSAYIRSQPLREVRSQPLRLRGGASRIGRKRSFRGRAAFIRRVGGHLIYEAAPQVSVLVLLY